MADDDSPVDSAAEPIPLGDRIKAKAKGKGTGKKRGPYKSKHKFAPLTASIEEVQDELSTMEGIARRRAELYKRARGGGTSLELEFIRLEKQLLNEAEKAVREGGRSEEIEELRRSLDALRKMMAGKAGSALRRDMVTPPPLARGKGDLQ